MPNIDVTQLLFDPDFAEALTIIQTAVTIGDNGRQVLTPTTVSPAPFGVVQPDTGSDLNRMPDAQYRPQRIKVWTVFRLSGPAPNQQPDRLEWGADTYVVAKVRNYTHFGAGYVYAECESLDFTDDPPE